VKGLVEGVATILLAVFLAIGGYYLIDLLFWLLA
jgi:hypothetical protein